MVELSFAGKGPTGFWCVKKRASLTRWKDLGNSSSFICAGWRLRKAEGGVLGLFDWDWLTLEALFVFFDESTVSNGADLERAFCWGVTQALEIDLDCLGVDLGLIGCLSDVFEWVESDSIFFSRPDTIAWNCAACWARESAWSRWWASACWDTTWVIMEVMVPSERRWYLHDSWLWFQLGSGTKIQMCNNISDRFVVKKGRQWFFLKCSSYYDPFINNSNCFYVCMEYHGWMVCDSFSCRMRFCPVAPSVAWLVGSLVGLRLGVACMFATLKTTSCEYEVQWLESPLQWNLATTKRLPPSDLSGILHRHINKCMKLAWTGRVSFDAYGFERKV